MRVDVYWNLHKDTFSVRATEGPQRGKVIKHTDRVALADAIFVVRDKARLAVRAGAPRTVHAWIRGTLLEFHPASLWPKFALKHDCGAVHSVTYNPKRDDGFVLRDKPELGTIKTARRVVCTTTNENKPLVLAQAISI